MSCERGAPCACNHASTSPVPHPAALRRTHLHPGAESPKPALPSRRRPWRAMTRTSGSRAAQRRPWTRTRAAQARKHRKSCSPQPPPSTPLGTARTPHLFLALLRAQNPHNPVRACRRTALPCVYPLSQPPQHKYPRRHNKNRSPTITSSPHIHPHSHQARRKTSPNHPHYNRLAVRLHIF